MRDRGRGERDRKRENYVCVVERWSSKHYSSVCRQKQFVVLCVWTRVCVCV